jgi:DNA polymerase I-like protein with 3'-5' exonuclease and polymerase domains
MSKLPEQFQLDILGEKIPCFYITKLEDAQEAFLKLIKLDTVFACDCETGALDKYTSDSEAALNPYFSTISLFQVFTGKCIVVFDILHCGQAVLPYLKSFIQLKHTIFHNVSFDLRFIKKWCGVDDPKMECSLIMSRILLQHLYFERRSASLKDMVKALFKIDLNKEAGRSDWSDPDRTFEQIKYSALDAYFVKRIYDKLLKTLTTLNLMQVYEIYREAQKVLVDIELEGIGFDILEHMQNVVQWRSELVDAQEELKSITGLNTITDTKLADYLERTLAPEVLEIWPRTDNEKKPKLKTDANTLVNFTFVKGLDVFANYQRLKKLCTSFGANLKCMINPETGRLHPHYTIPGARTGRLSCSGPNLQQSPKDPKFRNVFKAKAGYVYVAADYSQVEVRGAAEVSNDKELLIIYGKGLDAYRYTAARLNHKQMSEVTKPERQKAKALKLGLLYGLGPAKFSHYAKKNYQVEITQQQATKDIDAYRKLYSGLRQYQFSQVEFCKANNYRVFTVAGKSRKLKADSFYGAALNHKIQGSCAEIMQLALVFVSKKLKENNLDAKIVATIHDEMIIECREGIKQEVADLLVKYMTLAYTKIFPSGRTLLNLVKPDIGNTWAETKVD